MLLIENVPTYANLLYRSTKTKRVGNFILHSREIGGSSAIDKLLLRESMEDTFVDLFFVRIDFRY